MITFEGISLATRAGSSASRKFLKMLPAHFMVGGYFLLRIASILSAVSRNAAASPASIESSAEKIIQSL